MNDCELLELAAKAAGWESWDWLAGYGVLNVYDADGKHDTFNPLEDDGDALRLACHLFMTVSTGPVSASAATIAGALRGKFFKESTIDELDTAAAVRRVIVLAAAEIGGATA